MEHILFYVAALFLLASNFLHVKAANVWLVSHVTEGQKSNYGEDKKYGTAGWICFGVACLFGLISILTTS